MFAMMMIETRSPDERGEEDERPTNGLSARKRLGDHGQTKGRLPDPTAKVPGSGGGKADYGGDGPWTA